VAIEQLGQPIEVMILDGAVGLHEWCLGQRLHVSAQAPPAREAVTARELAAGIVGANTARRRDPLRASFVILNVAAERLLSAEPRNMGLELRPARETVLACELELRRGELDASRPGEFLRLLAQLLEIQVKRHCRLLSVVPVCPLVRAERSCVIGAVHRGWARPFPRTGRGPSRARTDSS
jgi:hypothetical protein